MTIDQTVAQVRQKYTFDPTVGPTNDQCAAICNEAAWIHRNDPEQWGVSGKPLGNNGTLSDGSKIAIDIIQNGITLEIFDCLIAAGGPDPQTGRYGPATAAWQPGGVLDSPLRPYKAPINPGTTPPDPPDPPLPPTGCPCKIELAELRQEINTLTQSITQLSNQLALESAELEALARVGRTFKFRIFGVNGSGSVDPVV